MRRIKLTQGYYALVDDEDYQRVSQFKWYAYIDKKKDGSIRNVYARHKDRGQKTIHMHRLILDVTDAKLDIDHCPDPSGLNNQRNNVRVATRTQNMCNSRKRADSTSGYKGVSWYKALGKWAAYINVKGKIHLGYFSTAKQAALAYDAKARELFEEFAYTNFGRK